MLSLNILNILNKKEVNTMACGSKGGKSKSKGTKKGGKGKGK